MDPTQVYNDYSLLGKYLPRMKVVKTIPVKACRPSRQPIDLINMTMFYNIVVGVGVKKKDKSGKCFSLSMSVLVGFNLLLL